MSAPATLFIDRDGTLIVEPDDEQVDSLDKVQLVPGVIPALLRLRDGGFRFVLVTNQDGLGTASFPAEDFAPAQDFTLELFASQGIRFDDVLICPHKPADGCACRKPRTGLVERYLGDGAINMQHSCVIGDRETDVELARNMGLTGLKLDNGLNWQGIADRLLQPPPRRAELTRKTRETDIVVEVDLDAGAENSGPIETGIGFFDHMLEQIARHGDFALTLRCDGDLDVDEHHTVEDTALTLGAALRDALGDKRGIGRYGFVVPMDEAQARAAIDLSGRSYLVFEGQFTRESVGGLPTELVPHFFRSLADALGASIQISVSGENNHHMIEAAFKGVGRCLRQALRREGTTLPSTKGLL